MASYSAADYVKALAVLGLQPGALIDDIRKAYKDLLRQCHPDHFPGDKAKEDQAKAINAAKDILDAMAKAGQLQIFAREHAYNARTGSGPFHNYDYGEWLKKFREEMDKQAQNAADAAATAFAESEARAEAARHAYANRRTIIFVVIAPAGMGKTQGFVKAQRMAVKTPGLMQQGKTIHTILASPTIILIDQTEKDLFDLGLDKKTAVKIHSKNTKGGVRPALTRYFMSQLVESDQILLITHSAILTNPREANPPDWDLHFDEMPNTVQFMALDCYATHFHLTNHVVAVSDGAGLYKLTPKPKADSIGEDEPFDHFARLVRISINRNPFDGGLEYYKPVAEALVNGYDVFVPSEQYDDLLKRSDRIWAGHIDILVLIPPTWFRDYRSITMMGARCLSHFTALMWSKLYNVDFVLDDRYNLPKKHTIKQAQRLTIHYIFEERATRAFLARKSKLGETLFIQVCESVAQFYSTFKDNAFLWSAPLEGEDKEYGVANDFWLKRKKTRRRNIAFEPDLRLPGMTHGLNEPVYMDTYNVALLSVVNLTPNQYVLLHAMGLTDGEIDKAMAFDVAYQDMARCNIRDRNGSHAIHVTVLDRATADDMAVEFTGCKVVQYPPELIPQGLSRGTRGPQASGAAKSNAERQRAWRARKAADRAVRDEQKREGG